MVKKNCTIKCLIRQKIFFCIQYAKAQKSDLVLISGLENVGYDEPILLYQTLGITIIK